MRIILKSAAVFSVTFLLLLPHVVFPAERWVEFHKEKWTQKSGKSGKKLAFTNRYFYDPESLIKSKTGNIMLSVKEISESERSSAIKKGPESETLFRQVYLWCNLKRYEVLQSDIDVGEMNESMSEEIKSGTYYEKLHLAVCKES